MILGPFVNHRLVSSSRHGSTYAYRVYWVMVPLLAIAGVWLYCDVFGWPLAPKVSLTDLAYLLMFTLMGGAVFWLPYSYALAGMSIPRERDKKTLDALLATELSSFEIVLGMVLESLVVPVTAMFTVLPLATFMLFHWGFDPATWILLPCAFLSTTFMLTTIGIFGSLGARTQSQAAFRTLWIAFAWGIAPIFCHLWLLPKLPMGITTAIRPAFLMALDAGPMSLMVNAIGLIPRGPMDRLALRMVGLELLGASVLIVWGSLRLREACRSVYDSEGKVARALHLQRFRRKRWPSCGDDPIYWRERFTSRGQNRRERWGGWAFQFLLFSCFAYLTYHFAIPAFQELFRFGYRTEKFDKNVSGMTVFTEAWIRGWNEAPQPGMARQEFNLFIRFMSPGIHFILSVLCFGFANESVTTERNRDTWPGLLVTPLSGQEILQGKRLGTLWRVRGHVFVLFGLWTIGTVTGAIHPLGFVAASIGLATSCWLGIELGMFLGLHPKESLVGLWAMPYLFGLMSALLIVVPFGSQKPLWWSIGSMPLFTFLSLASFDEVRIAAKTGKFIVVDMFNIEISDNVYKLIATAVGAWMLTAFGASYFHRAAIGKFDRLAGRPILGRVSANTGAEVPPGLHAGENLAIGPL